MRRKLLVSIGMVVALLGVAGCTDAGEPDREPSSDSSEQQGALQPDLEGVPDVVAEVNGHEITKTEFVEAYESQFQQSQTQAPGQEVDQDALRLQTAEALVTVELLMQEADARGLAATEDERDLALEQLAASAQLGSIDDVLAALKAQGMDEAEIYSQLDNQVRLDKLIASESDDSEPTDEELRNLYDQAVAQQEGLGGGEELPPFESVKPQLAEQAKMIKQSEAYEGLVTELRQNADVTIFL